MSWRWLKVVGFWASALLKHILAPVWTKRECVTEDLPVKPLGLAMCQGTRARLVLHSLAAALFSEGISILSLCSPHDLKFILIQNKNQMCRALGLGYEILLSHKKRRKSIYLFDFIPYLIAHFNFYFAMFCFNWLVRVFSPLCLVHPRINCS